MILGRLEANLTAYGFAVLISATQLGCGTSPPSEFFVLSPSPSQATDLGQQATAPQTSENQRFHIELRRPHLPPYLDREPLVQRGPSGKLVVSDTERWGGDLEEMVENTLSLNLGDLFPTSTVSTESGGLSGNKDLLIEVQFARFERDSDGAIHVRARVALLFDRSDATWQSFPFSFTRAVGSSARAQVDGLNLALSELARFIAERIQNGLSSTDVASAGDPAPSERFAKER